MAARLTSIIVRHQEVAVADTVILTFLRVASVNIGLGGKR